MKLFKYYHFVLVLFLLSCSEEKGAYFYPSLGFGEPKIAVLSNSTGVLSLSLYTLDGTFVKILHNFNQDGSPRGVDQLDARTLIAATDTPDQIITIDLITLESKTLINSSFLTGNIYQARSYANRIFISEGNNIEVFENLIRIPEVGVPAFIPASVTTGSETCTISTARGLAISKSGVLAVVSTNRVSLYDITGLTPSCLKEHTFTDGPRSIAFHDNGNFYVASFTGDAIYELPSNGSGSPTQIFQDTAVIDGPTAITALPDGSLAVAASVQKSIERIDVEGNRLSTTSFIKDVFTGTVADLLLIKGY